MKIGYWKIRGLAQPIRLLLNYTGLEFEEVQYEDREKWFKADKIDLGLEFPNLPYLLDGDFKLTESLAIAKYIIKKSGNHSLLGKGLNDQITVTTLFGVNSDMVKEYSKLIFDKDFQKNKGAVLDKIKDKLTRIDKLIGDKDFVLGYLTWIDFLLAEQVHHLNALYPEQAVNFPNLWRLRTTFNAIPAIKSYYKRATALTLPFFPPMAAVQIHGSKVKLAYWGIQGLAEIPRLLLAYNKIQFEDHHYTEGDKWFKEDKLALHHDFPNLPYLVDDHIVVTESSAVAEYIIKKAGNKELLGKNLVDFARLTALLQVWNDVHSAARGLFFNKDWETVKGAELEKITPKLVQLQRVIGKRKFAFDYLTLADFYIAFFSNFVQAVWPQTAAKYPFLTNIKNNFYALPEIAAHYANPTTKKLSFYPESAFIKIAQ